MTGHANGTIMLIFPLVLAFLLPPSQPKTPLSYEISLELGFDAI